LKHSEEYFCCSKKGLLEECYPSLRLNIWCYPTLRVLTISCVQYFGEWFGVLLVRLRVITEVIFADLFRNLTIGIIYFSLSKEWNNFLVHFAFFLKGKKGVAHFRLNYETLCSEFSENNWIFQFLSEKYPIEKKTSVETKLRK
jgi:hypothetical protein